MASSSWDGLPIPGPRTSPTAAPGAPSRSAFTATTYESLKTYVRTSPSPVASRYRKRTEVTPFPVSFSTVKCAFWARARKGSAGSSVSVAPGNGGPRRARLGAVPGLLLHGEGRLLGPREEGIRRIERERRARKWRPLPHEVERFSGAVPVMRQDERFQGSPLVRKARRIQRAPHLDQLLGARGHRNGALAGRLRCRPGHGGLRRRGRRRRARRRRGRGRSGPCGGRGRLRRRGQNGPKGEKGGRERESENEALRFQGISSASGNRVGAARVERGAAGA